jgi:hypothetical protein
MKKKKDVKNKEVTIATEADGTYRTAASIKRASSPYSKKSKEDM